MTAPPHVLIILFYVYPSRGLAQLTTSSEAAITRTLHCYSHSLAASWKGEQGERLRELAASLDLRIRGSRSELVFRLYVFTLTMLQRLQSLLGAKGTADARYKGNNALYDLIGWRPDAIHKR